MIIVKSELEDRALEPVFRHAYCSVLCGADLVPGELRQWSPVHVAVELVLDLAVAECVRIV